MASCYELHSVVYRVEPTAGVTVGESAGAFSPLRVDPVGHAGTAGEALLWASVGGESGDVLRRASGQAAGDVGFRAVMRPIGSALGVLWPQGGWVNGLPALSFSVVTPRDLLTIGDGGEAYVTERVTPHFGPASTEMIGQKCPVCRTRIEAESFVLTCRCGGVMHFETAETTPDRSSEDRWDCGAALKNCLACGHELTTDSYLVWDPNEL